jgi:hypothetical protein
MTYTTLGAFYTILCVVLAALKAVMSGEILSGEMKLHPMDLLLKMCPLALMQTSIMCVLSGELQEILSRSFSLSACPTTLHPPASSSFRWNELASGSVFHVVLISGILAFSLNWSSFVANRVTSALTLCIAANVKQVMVVGASTMYFGDSVGFINGIGILVVMVASFR